MKVTMVSNENVKQLFIGAPPNHKHLRILLQLDENWFIFSEATIANMVRVFIDIKTHPARKTAQLKQTMLAQPKEDYAKYQLLEVNKSEKKLQKEFNKLWTNLGLSG